MWERVPDRSVPFRAAGYCHSEGKQGRESQFTPLLFTTVNVSKNSQQNCVQSFQVDIASDYSVPVGYLLLLLLAVVVVSAVRPVACGRTESEIRKLFGYCVCLMFYNFMFLFYVLPSLSLCVCLSLIIFTDFFLLLQPLLFPFVSFRILCFFFFRFCCFLISASHSLIT